MLNVEEEKLLKSLNSTRVMVQQFDDRKCQIKDINVTASGHEFVQFYCLLVAVYGTNPYRFVVTDFTANGNLGRDITPDLESYGLEPHLLLMVLAADTKIETVLREYHKYTGSNLIERYGTDETLLEKFCVVSVNAEIRLEPGRLMAKATRIRLLNDMDRGIPSLNHIYKNIVFMDPGFLHKNIRKLKEALPFEFLKSLPNKPSSSLELLENQDLSLQFPASVKSEPLAEDALIPDSQYHGDYVDETLPEPSPVTVLPDAPISAALATPRRSVTPVTIADLVSDTGYSDRLYPVSALVVSILPIMFSHICVKTPASLDPTIRPIQLLITEINETPLVKPKYLNETNSLRLHLDAKEIRQLFTKEPAERLFVNERLWQDTVGKIIGKKVNLVIHKKLVPIEGGQRVAWTCSSISS